MKNIKSAANYIVTVYGLNTFARTVEARDAASLTDLMQDFSDYNLKVSKATEMLEMLKSIAFNIKKSEHYWMDSPDGGGFDLAKIEELIKTSYNDMKDKYPAIGCPFDEPLHNQKTDKMTQELTHNVGSIIRVHTPGLIKEILNNKETWALQIPLQIFQSLLAQVASEAIRINDKKLNALMLRLVLYEDGDPYSKDYNGEQVLKYIKESTL